MSHALDLSARSWERMRRKRRRQGAGLLAGRDVPAKPGIQSRPREPGASCSLLFCSAGVTAGLGRAGEAGADTPAQSWQGPRPQLSLGYTGTHMIQVTASCYACLTLCSRIRTGGFSPKMVMGIWLVGTQGKLQNDKGIPCARGVVTKGCLRPTPVCGESGVVPGGRVALLSPP